MPRNHATLDQLDGDALSKLSVGSFGEHHLTHAADAEHLHHTIRTQHLTEIIVRLCIARFLCGKLEVPPVG